MLIGDQPIRRFRELKVPKAGILKLLTPTDCVKDRLAAYYHWNDRQGLNQAVWVAEAHAVKIKDVTEWSIREGHREKLQDFLAALKQAKN